MKNLLIVVAMVTALFGTTPVFADESQNVPQFQHFEGEEQVQNLTEQEKKEAKGAGVANYVVKYMAGLRPISGMAGPYGTALANAAAIGAAGAAIIDKMNPIVYSAPITQADINAMREQSRINVLNQSYNPRTGAGQTLPNRR